MTIYSFGQTDRPEDFGFRHLQTTYKGDTVDILIKSKKGEENERKPIFLFCQGSLPAPLIIKYKDKDKVNIYNVFVFTTDSLSKYFHLVIIGKPHIPLIAGQAILNKDFSYSDSSGGFPKEYLNRNYLDYYVGRNIAVIKFLEKQKFISPERLIVAGHSEGATVAAKLSSSFPKITHLIYASGNPFGRIMSMIGNSRHYETDTSKMAETDFLDWQKAITAGSEDLGLSKYDTYRTLTSFSSPPIEYLRKLKIPVLDCYGTRDWCAPFNDYFRVETIKMKMKNFTFNAYIGCEHNFFPVRANGEADYSVFNWDKVAMDWLNWITHN